MDDETKALLEALDNAQDFHEFTVATDNLTAAAPRLARENIALTRSLADMTVYELMVDYDGNYSSMYSHSLYRSKAAAEKVGKRLAKETHQPNISYSWLEEKYRTRVEKKMLGGWNVRERKVL